MDRYAWKQTCPYLSGVFTNNTPLVFAKTAPDVFFPGVHYTPVNLCDFLRFSQE
jgi:hypothetical protein